jgi:hypothetical protein
MVTPVILWVFLIFTNFFATVRGQYAPDYPSPLPVVIKSPYFNFWLASDSDLTTPGGRWPVFYTGLVRRYPGFSRPNCNNDACRMSPGVDMFESTAQVITFKESTRIILQRKRSAHTSPQRGLSSRSMLAPFD